MKKEYIDKLIAKWSSFCDISKGCLEQLEGVKMNFMELEETPINIPPLEFKMSCTIPIVRMTFPSTISSKLFQEMPMNSDAGSVFYINPFYKKKQVFIQEEDFDI